MNSQRRKKCRVQQDFSPAESFTSGSPGYFRYIVLNNMGYHEFRRLSSTKKHHQPKKKPETHLLFIYFLFYVMKCFLRLFLTISAFNQLPQPRLHGYPTGFAVLSLSCHSAQGAHEIKASNIS